MQPIRIRGARTHNLRNVDLELPRDLGPLVVPHGSITVENAESCIAMAELTGMAPIVRPVANYGLPEWLRVSVGLPEENRAFIDALTLFGIGASWGGYGSLIIPFDCKDVRTATQWAPGGPTVRLHIGLEDADDLIADLFARNATRYLDGEPLINLVNTKEFY